MSDESVEIICSVCGADTFVKREPVYDGFRKTGECYVCVSCGHRYSEKSQVPFKQKEPPPVVFTDEDRPEKVEVFHDSEKRRNCRYCEHYIVNPFTQRCGLNWKEVEATGLCDDFKAAVVSEEEKGGKNAGREKKLLSEDK